MELKVKKEDNDAVMPTKAHKSDSGYDLTIIKEIKIIDDYTRLYGTGLKFEIPTGYYLEVFPRSSISKLQLSLANSVGIIDEQYRGELLVPLRRIDKSVSWPKLPLKICQFIMKKKVSYEIKEVSKFLSATERGENGFGSSDMR